MEPNETNETKIELTHRLQRENRWEQAELFLGEQRAKFKAEGMTRAASNEKGWESLPEKFPPLPPSELGVSENDAGDAIDEGVEALYESLETSESSESLAADLTTDTIWVYNHLDHQSVTAADAPGPGAWSMLKWARRARNRFFEYSLPKALIAKAEQDEQQDEENQTSAPQLAEIERMLSEIDEEEAAEEAKRDRVINCPTCSQRILLVRPESKQYTSELEYPEPCVCPATHPNYGEPAGV